MKTCAISLMCKQNQQYCHLFVADNDPNGEFYS